MNTDRAWGIFYLLAIGAVLIGLALLISGCVQTEVHDPSGVVVKRTAFLMDAKVGHVRATTQSFEMDNYDAQERATELAIAAMQLAAKAAAKP